MQPHHLPDGGGTYYSILFYVVLLFGLTELKAQISWIDNVCRCMDLVTTRANWTFVRSFVLQGVEVRRVDIEPSSLVVTRTYPLSCRSPASVVYEDTVCLKRP